MNDTRLAELREKYQDRNLMEELAWGTYASHSGYVNKANGEFINWLCNSAYRELKKSDRPTGRWVLDPNGYDWNLPAWKCSECGCKNNNIGVVDKGFAKNPLVWAGSKFCPNCGARMEGSE